MRAPEYDPDYSEEGVPGDHRCQRLRPDVRRVPPQGGDQAPGHRGLVRSLRIQLRQAPQIRHRVRPQRHPHDLRKRACETQVLLSCTITNI